jgi:hypothetical protein
MGPLGRERLGYAAGIGVEDAERSARWLSLGLARHMPLGSGERDRFNTAVGSKTG